MEGQRNIVKDALHILASALGINGSDISQEDVETMAKSKADLVKDLCTRLELNADDDAEGFNSLSAGVLRKILNAFGKPDPEEEPEKDPEEDEEPMPQEQEPESETEPEAEPETQAEEDEDDEPEEKPQANEQPCAKVTAQQADIIKVLEQRIADLEQRSEASEDVVRQYQEDQAREKSQLVSDLTANERCVFSKDELERQDVPMLQKLARSLMPRSYAGQEGGPTANSKQDTRPIVPWSGNRAGKE